MDGADSVLNFSKSIGYNIYESAFTFFRSGVIEVHHIVKNDKTVVGGVGNMGSISGDRMTIVCSSSGKAIAKTDGLYGYATPSVMSCFIKLYCPWPRSSTPWTINIIYNTTIYCNS